ncbi:MAG: tetratricopeptide repeat protein, partial [Candidatus Obscuribacter sp.]|nr:tetratricopeptide repeat protein [Candidatus Obscuribacter sp.]
MRLYKSGILTAISLALMAQVNCQASEPMPIAKSETAQSEQKSTLAPWEQLMEKATEAHNKNQFDSALSLARQALKILQDGGKRDRDLTFVMETVGLFTYEKGNYKEADEIIERAMEINIALSGRKSRVVVNNLNMLGRIKRHEKDLPEAKKLTQEAITIASQLKDNGTPDEATLTHNLGRIYQEENDFEHAKECYLKAIELTEKAGKTNTDAYVTYKQNLGTLYLKNGNLDKAKELMDSSLKLKESLGHANDKNTAFIKGNLAQVAIKQGDTERAKELYKGAIGILAKGVDPNKQHLAKFMDAYGDLLDDINNPQTKTTKTVSKAITDRDLGENVTFEQIKNEPYLPPLNFKPSIIKLLVKKNPENLLTDFKSDPIEAAKQIKNAPLFVFAYLSMITKHLENGTRPTFISPDEWNITVEKWKKERANENNLR